MNGAENVVFLDRDGTIIEDKHYLQAVSRVELIEGAVDALKKLQDAGYTLAVVTNQSGVARGKLSEQDVQDVNSYLRNILAQRGVHIRSMVYCPYHPAGSIPKYAKDDDCRKPKTGMAKQVEQVVGDIDYEHSWSIGDKPADHEFGKNLGMKTVLLRGEYWDEEPNDPAADIVADSLEEAVEQIAAE